MAAVGRLLLIFALATTVYGLGASIHGAGRGGRAWVDSGRRAMYVLWGMAAIAFVILDVAFITSNFSYAVVASGSSTTTPTFYRVAAIWSTQQGSLLLWLLLLSGWSSLALFITRRRVREIAPYAQATLFALAAFFTGLLVFFAKPFATSPMTPAEGAGLDPLLRHTTMMIHPPMLYSGYTLMMVPFAFAVGALITGRLSAEWIQVTRRFALGAWLCLGFGVMLGARWSYTELGWGGYWAWDPVENAALMPWLVATAYIHSIMIQEKRGMLKVWNISLILLAGALAIVGDFLVRSGILSSIHAFVSDPTLNFSFVALIAVITLGSVGLVIWRRAGLRTDVQLESLISREGVFMLQNFVLVAIAAVVFWLTFFPLISEAITGTQTSVGPPAFNEFVVPLALVVVVLSGIGPLIAWRRVTAAKLRRSFLFPVAAGLVALVVLSVMPGVLAHGFALAVFVSGTFVAAAVAQEFFRGTRARQTTTAEPAPVALGRLVRRNRRRYGGYTVHLGVAVALVGIAASTSFAHSRVAYLKPGQSVALDGYDVKYVQPTARASAQRISFGANLAISRGGKFLETLHTEYGLYPGLDPLHPIGRFFETNNGASAESRVGLDAGLTRDIWIDISPNITPLGSVINRGDALIGRALTNAATLPPAQRTKQLDTLYQLRDVAIRGIAQRFVNHPWAASFKIIISPLVTWLWAGAIIAVLGGLLALWPLPARRRRPGPPSPTRSGAQTAAPERRTARELVTRMAAADGEAR